MTVFLLLLVMDLAGLRKMFSNISQVDFELTVAYVLHVDRLWVLTHSEYELTAAQSTKIHGYLNELTNDTPLAYIVGLKRFYDVDFEVNNHVLIPRQETEELVSIVATLLNKSQKSLQILDIGTGSGCIGISLARIASQHKYYLVDKSKRALQIAKNNAARILPGSTNMLFLQGDLLSACHDIVADCIVANLPYLSDAILADSPVSVTEYEPHLALYGGPDGLVLYRRLLRQMQVLYRDKKWPDMWWEISPEQVSAIEHIALKLDMYKIHIIQDLSGRARFVHFYTT